MKRFYKQILVVTIFLEILAIPSIGISESNNSIIDNVKISGTSFNPKRGEDIGILYTLKESARVVIDIYDPDYGLIKRLIDNKTKKAGKNKVIWDGKDEKGGVVPNEAYFFTIKAITESNAKDIYDPATFSGGIEHDITKVKIDSISQTLTYKLPEMGRVMIRIGIKGGPLLRNLVQWEPRIAGEVTEFWNGMDEDNLFDLRNDPNFKMIITYFTLHENSVITYGNKDISYREYKSANIPEITKEKRPRNDKLTGISPHYKIPRVVDYAPQITMTFPLVKERDSNGIPLLKGKVLVRVELNKNEKEFFTNQQYEVAFFLDKLFHAEEEVGYSPYNWVWNVSSVSEGEHILTLNMSSFKDQIGVISKKVKIVK